MLVHQILRSKPDEGVVTIAPGATIAQAAELLSSRRIGAVIVSKDGDSPLGILSERDIVRELGKSGSGCLTDKVDVLMTSKLVSCRPEDAADAILAQMTEGRFRHMPVMKGEKDGGADFHWRRGQGAPVGTGHGKRGPDRHDYGQLRPQILSFPERNCRLAEALRDGEEAIHAHWSLSRHL